ncbi:class I SAM-dependent methyltransferase [Actinoplanes sp. RD1]|uniref:class I SAM-dependent methyltransferase n=1 Tax=Actinoplanes sp. RD1 TaxID=3064538 RepID=UPI00274154DA|nr:class I SAM-dependent methyltransferase [Actinoplanes sp. RD1]
MDRDNIMRLLDGLVATLLAPLDELPAGAHVVQVACGTGGLALALARRRPDLRITGIDINPAVVAAGQARAAGEGLPVGFRVMSMTELEFPDGTVDAVTSRMGLLLPGTAPFGDSAREARRVLRPGGILSIATWSDLAGSPYTRFGLDVLRRVLPPGEVPDLEAPFAASARPGVLDGHLAGAGLRDVEGSWFRWETEYPDFAAWWDFVAGFGPVGALFGALGEERHAAARRLMAATIAGHRTATGAYRLPATARVLTARR